VAFGSRLASGDSDTQPSLDTPSPSITVPTPAVDSDPATQPVWDPFDLDRAPTRSTRLPPRLAPSAGPEGTEVLQTMPEVLVVWPQEDADLQLLGTDGRWRSVPGTRDALQIPSYDMIRAAISSDGTQVAMSTDDGIRVLDVTTGADRTIEWPAEVAPPWDAAPGLRWLPGDQGVMVLHWKRTWIVGLDGSSREAPFQGRYVSLAVDPDGSIYQNDYERRSLLTWQDDEVVDDVPFVQCERMVAAYGLLSCTTGSLGGARSGPVVVDPATGEIVAYAPIKDRNSVYSDNGHLTSLGFLDEDTVLLLVGAMDFNTMEIGEETWYLVAWQFRTGTFERITSGETQMREIAVAPGLVE